MHRAYPPKGPQGKNWRDRFLMNFLHQEVPRPSHETRGKAAGNPTKKTPARGQRRDEPLELQREVRAEVPGSGRLSAGPPFVWVRRLVMFYIFCK